MKRTFDILAAAAGLVLTAPILLLLVLAIRWQSPGPAIFSQMRVGRHRRPFTCYKLRTMYAGTAQKPTHEIGASSVTPIGSFIRRTKLDEIPQLFNVLIGDMSVVGPRPCLPSQVSLIELRQRHDVFSVRPGITGLAQTLDVDMSDPGRLARIDGEYVRTRSLSGDFKIILSTLLGSGMGVDRTVTGGVPLRYPG